MFWDVVTLEENTTFLHRIVTKIITENEKNVQNNVRMACDKLYKQGRNDIVVSLFLHFLARHRCIFAVFSMSVSSRKYPPPFLHTNLRQNWGRRCLPNIQFVTCIHPSSRSSQSFIRAKLTIVMTAVAFWKNCSFNECVLQEISWSLLTLSQEASKQLA